MSLAYIGLGSNQGERELLISRAVQLLHQHPAMRVTQLSLLKEYDPVGGPPQEKFVNAVVEIATELAPEALLGATQGIERALGRRGSTERWGPRPIDLDILLYGDHIMQSERLTIPHPRLAERRFVLEPLTQIAPQAVHPQLHRTVQELWEALCASSDPFGR